MGRGRARPLGRLEVKTLGRKDQEDEQDDAPVVAEGHRHTWNGKCQPGHGDQRLRSIAVASVPHREPRSSEPPERAALRCEGGHKREVLGPHRADLFW